MVEEKFQSFKLIIFHKESMKRTRYLTFIDRVFLTRYLFFRLKTSIKKLNYFILIIAKNSSKHMKIQGIILIKDDFRKETF